MARIKLTERVLAKLPAPDPSGKQKLHWCDDLKGFGVLCSGVSAAKTFVVQRDLPDGRTRRITIGPLNVWTLDKARSRAQSILADFYQGRDPKSRPPTVPTLRATLSDYLAARKDLRSASRANYAFSIERHLKSWLELPLSDITPEMVEARHRSIQAEIEKRPGRTGEATANDAMRVFRVMWNFAAERSPLPPNPVTRLRRQWFAVPRRERTVRSEELSRFYAAVAALPNPIARDYLVLLLFTGLRRREAAGLRWDDVDFAGRLVRLPAARTKAGRRLDLPMTDVVRDVLVSRRALVEGPFVFPANAKSGHIEEPQFPLEQVATATGIKVSAHDLRRTFITVAESTDMSPLALKALVNHSIGSDVTAGYVQMSVERLREPAQKVCDRLKALCGIGEAQPANVVKL